MGEVEGFDVQSIGGAIEKANNEYSIPGMGVTRACGILLGPK